MSWTDSQSIRVMKYLRDKYNIKEFVETGTYKGINAYLHSSNFESVLTCEKIPEYYNIAKERLSQFKNVECCLAHSPTFLKDYVDIKHDIYIPLFYLDAHFYDPKLPKGKDKFVVIDELKSLKGLEKCVIVIHDFHNNLGHITYDDIDLDLELIKDDLYNINSNFYLYTNELKSCDIVKYDYFDILKAGLEDDDDVLENLDYAWKEPRLTYRGFLYCLPTELSKKEMKNLGLNKWH